MCNFENKYNEKDNNINYCFSDSNTEECLFKFFSIEGPISKVDPNKVWDLMILEDKNKSKLCIELGKNYKSDYVKLNLVKVGVYNKIPCTCDYIKNKIINPDGNYEEYNNYYIHLQCSN